MSIGPKFCPIFDPNSLSRDLLLCDTVFNALRNRVTGRSMTGKKCSKNLSRRRKCLYVWAELQVYHPSPVFLSSNAGHVQPATHQQPRRAHSVPHSCMTTQSLEHSPCLVAKKCIHLPDNRVIKRLLVSPKALQCEQR